MPETYTPDTAEVREAALFWAAGRGKGTTPEDYDAAGAAFDRWLAQEKRLALLEWADKIQPHFPVYAEKTREHARTLSPDSEATK